MDLHHSVSSLLKLLTLFVGAVGLTKSNSDFQNACISPGWIPYKDGKCFKILESRLPFGDAVAACKELLPFEELTGCSHPSTLLSIYSYEEQHFINSNILPLLSSNNIWIDVKQNQSNHNASNQTVSEDGYSNWASGQPRRTSDSDSNLCADVEVNALDKSTEGKWRSLSCLNSRRIVCQNLQRLPIQDIQNELLNTRRDLSFQAVEIQGLKDLVRQLMISHEKISTTDQSLESTNRLIQQLEGNCISTQPFDLKPDKTNRLEKEVEALKSELKILTSPLSQVQDLIVELRGTVVGVKDQLGGLRVQTDSFHIQMKTLSEAIKESTTGLTRGVEQATNLVNSLQGPIEGVRSDVQTLRLKLTGVEVPFEKAKSDITHLRGQVANLEIDILRRVGEVQGNLNVFKSTAITNLRFGGPEHKAIWKGPGYGDENGYVITSISNFNWDAFADGTSRRRIQKLVNGVWLNI